MSFSVTIAHDYLTQRGGAERVALALVREFPNARFLTSVYNASTTFSDFAEIDVETLVSSRLSLARANPKVVAPLLARCFSRRVIDTDVLICSSSGWAHALQTTGFKVVYCHNPARWLYQPDDYFQRLPRPLRRQVSLALGPVRRRDRAWAKTANLYLANSSVVQDRISRAYGIKSVVVPPPAGLDAAGPLSAVDGIAPGFLLVVSRARTYKNTSAVCRAVLNRTDERLVVVGRLPDGAGIVPSDRLFECRDVLDSELRWLYANCRAVVAAAREDFGLTPVEAFQFGKPVIALRAGGYLDTVTDGATGVFFDDESDCAIGAAINRSRGLSFDEDYIRTRGSHYSRRNFGERVRALLPAG